MSSFKEIKNPRLIKITRNLKDQEDSIEKINKIEELETEIKRKLNATEKEKNN